MATEPAEEGAFAPKTTLKQVEALHAVQELADRDHLALSMDPGEFAFINDPGMLHAWEEFVDTPKNTQYLVRMWLKSK